MPTIDLVILYVDNPKTSAAFYADLLYIEPAELSPTFARFELPSGIGLGLWSRHTVQPVPQAGAGGGELAVVVDDVDVTYADWANRGLRIVQNVTDMDFGRTFVALDPDLHRLRVFKPI